MIQNHCDENINLSAYFVAYNRLIVKRLFKVLVLRIPYRLKLFQDNLNSNIKTFSPSCERLCSC